MKKFILPLFVILFSGFAARAQVFILNDNIFQKRMSTIKATVLDSLTNEPLSFVSVYVVPSKDTTITNFTLTDAQGAAKLEEVPFGSYIFRVEILGYKPFIKERFFRDEIVDLGKIRLHPDKQYLQAAVVSDVGNPIIIKKDTVEFNASSYRVGSNAMLKDLLMRMPGMEITEEGKVKFNGELIDKLTVGGRTFFFNDQSTAINNLPASVVDKIRVIDRDSEQARATGIQDGGKEKVLDVALKKEYEKGWFGNVGLKGGTTLGSKDGADDLRDQRGLLYNGNALISAYSEKDQLTIVANGLNINDSNVMVFVSYGGSSAETINPVQGLSSAAQMGVNLNTSRIKDVETTVSANYKYSDTDSGSRSRRTTYQDDGNLVSSSEIKGKAFANTMNADLEFKKEKGNLWFHIRPSFQYSRQDAHTWSESEVSHDGAFANSSSNNSSGLTLGKTAALDADVTFRQLWGKANRSIQLESSFSYGDNSEQSDEYSELKTAFGTETRAMNYRGGSGNLNWNTSLRYTEPFGDKWMLSATGKFSQARRNSARDAFDAGGRNDYYSSVSNNDYRVQQYELTAQYTFGKGNTFSFGCNAIGVSNELYSKSFGIDSTTGKDEWNWSVTPNIRFRHNAGNNMVSIFLNGYNQRPNTSRMLPVLNITDPSRLSLGNVYLKSSTQTYMTILWRQSNRERFSSTMVQMSGNYIFNPSSYARWYDNSGILYSLPVNALKPSISAFLSADHTTPLDARKEWSLTVSLQASYSSSTSYQTRKRFTGLDKDSFDYATFMADFWGNAGGDRFYSGESGFEESTTRTLSPYAGFRVRYSHERFSFDIGANTSGELSRYTLDPSVNRNILNSRFFAYGNYTTKHGFELDSKLSYTLYSGYPEGYNKPEFKWDAEISKNIGAFNLSIKVKDILNQTRSLTHIVTENYEENSYRLIMGRYILFGVKWNFGKMNSAHSSRAQRAAINLAM